MTTSPLLNIHTDGASRGNPGQAAYAYVIHPEQGDDIEEAGCLGTMTNNQAEYTALVRALEHALELGRHHRLVIHSDSELLVKQMNGEYRVKNEDLRDLFEEAQKLRKRFDGAVLIHHVRRAANSRADQLCNEVLDGTRLSSVRDVLKKPAHAPKQVVAPQPSLDEQAVKVLEKAAHAWKQGRAEPGVESVWQHLVQLLKQHGVHMTPKPELDGKPSAKTAS